MTVLNYVLRHILRHIIRPILGIFHKHACRYVYRTREDNIMLTFLILFFDFFFTKKPQVSKTFHLIRTAVRDSYFGFNAIFMNS